MITRKFEFKNGDEVVDKISGFKGIITGISFYITGCNQYLVTTKMDGNKEPTSLWCDEGRLKLVKKDVIKKKDVKSEDNGCDIPPLIGKRGA